MSVSAERRVTFFEHISRRALADDRVAVKVLDKFIPDAGAGAIAATQVIVKLGYRDGPERARSENDPIQADLVRARTEIADPAPPVPDTDPIDIETQSQSPSAPGARDAQ